MVRTFLSFDVEDEDVIGRIVEVQKRLMLSGGRVKLVKPENIHMTLRFLGEIPSEKVDLISKEMDGLRFPQFKIELRGLGAFPKPNYPRVVWVGIKEGARELTEIFNQMEPRLTRLGVRPEPRPFHPHLTIARVKGGGRSKLVDVIRDLSDYDFGIIEGRCFRLKRSTLTIKGPVYSTLHEVTAT